MNRYEKLLKDALASYKRLNEELAERIDFESKLMEIIQKKDEEINKLKEQLESLSIENGPLNEYLQDIDKPSIKSYTVEGRLS